MDPLDQYRCEHGHLLLSCPEGDCPEQNDYLARTVARMQAYEQRQIQEARDLVAEIVGQLQ